MRVPKVVCQAEYDASRGGSPANLVNGTPHLISSFFMKTILFFCSSLLSNYKGD